MMVVRRYRYKDLLNNLWNKTQIKYGIQIYCDRGNKQAAVLRGGGGGIHSNLRCRDTFLKIVSLLKNCRSEGGKSIHFWEGLCTGFSKISKSLQ